MSEETVVEEVKKESKGQIFKRRYGYTKRTARLMQKYKVFTFEEYKAIRKKRKKAEKRSKTSRVKEVKPVKK